MVTARRSSDLVLYTRLLRQARPSWPHLTALLTLNLLTAPLALLTPYPLTIAVDSVIGSLPPPRALLAILPDAIVQSDGAVLVVAVALLVGIALVTQGLALGTALLRAHTAATLVLAFRARLFAHAQRLSLAYHDTKGTAHSTYRIQYDAPAIQHIAVDGLIPLLTALITLASMIVVTARIDGSLALIALGISPILYLLASAYQRPLRVGYRELGDVDTSALSVVQEVLSTIRVVKAYGTEEHEQARFLRHANESTRARVRLSLMEGKFSLLIGLCMTAGTAAVLFMGVRHVQAGVLTLGELILVMAYLALLYAPLRTISTKVADIQSSLVSAERAFALLDEGPDVAEREGARSLARARGDVIFRSVSFAYEPGRRVLENISFAVAPGARVGIAGATGAGKTTLVSLLTRFYDPTAGAILLDGVDLRDYRLADLRAQFGIVLQEPVLFSTSIAENIAYARFGARDDEIVAAATAADAHDFISRLPDGYATLVGERGMRLSGGERQRIALARAFLKDAPILILDEPTSSVDMGTESAIMAAMERLMRGRTTFIIAHRLGTLQHCDVRLEIEGGRLIEGPVAARAG